MRFYLIEKPIGCKYTRNQLVSQSVFAFFIKSLSTNTRSEFSSNRFQAVFDQK